MIDDLIDTWNIHNRINLYLLNAISDEAMSGVSASKWRSVGAEFAHMHAVRLMWIEPGAPELMAGLSKLEKTQYEDKLALRDSLEKSGVAMASFLRQGFEAGKIKGYKPHPAAFMGYLISHESYHRGEIGMILKQAGFPLDEKVS